MADSFFIFSYRSKTKQVWFGVVEWNINATHFHKVKMRQPSKKGGGSHFIPKETKTENSEAMKTPSFYFMNINAEYVC